MVAPAFVAMVAHEQHCQECAHLRGVALASLEPPSVSSGMLHRVADRLGVRRQHRLDAASRAAVVAATVHFENSRERLCRERLHLSAL